METYQLLTPRKLQINTTAERYFKILAVCNQNFEQTQYIFESGYHDITNINEVVIVINNKIFWTGFTKRIAQMQAILRQKILDAMDNPNKPPAT